MSEKLIKVQINNDLTLVSGGVLLDNVTVQGSNIPVSIRKGVKEREFYILPFNKEKGVILLSGSCGSQAYCCLFNVSMVNGAPYVHKMNNDEKKWIPSRKTLTQYCGIYLEVQILDGVRYTNNPDGFKNDMYVVTGDSLCEFLMEEITEAELRKSATAEPEIVMLKRTMERMQKEFYKREDQMADDLEKIKAEARWLQNENTRLKKCLLQVKKLINILRKSVDSLVENSKGWYFGQYNILKIGRGEIEIKAIEAIYEIDKM